MTHEESPSYPACLPTPPAVDMRPASVRGGRARSGTFPVRASWGTHTEAVDAPGARAARASAPLSSHALRLPRNMHAILLPPRPSMRTARRGSRRRTETRKRWCSRWRRTTSTRCPLDVRLSFTNHTYVSEGDDWAMDWAMISRGFEVYKPQHSALPVNVRRHLEVVLCFFQV